MILSVRQSVNLFTVAMVLAIAGCQQHAGDDPKSDTAANNPNETDNLQEITLAVTGMT